MKRYLYIIIGIVAAAAIIIVVLFLIKNNGNVSINTVSTSTVSGSLPAVGAQNNNTGATSTTAPLSLPSSTSTPGATTGQVAVQNFGVLSDVPMVDYFIDGKNVIAGIEPTGQVVSVSNGKTTVVNSSTLNAIISAGFSYDGKKIVVSYGDPANPQGALYDATANTW